VALVTGEAGAAAAGPVMDPAVTTKRTLPPGRLGSRITQTSDAYVIGHLGIAQVAAPGWSLRVDGLVGNVLRFSLPQLRALPSVTVTAVLECFGNPLEPTIPVRRAANVRWRGVPVRALLDAAEVRPGASTVWARGLDSGQFDGTDCACYLKDLPLATVAERGIIAYEMNGEPLTSEHGFPARLFMPGYFGTNNVKWLAALTLADRRPEHLFTTRLYQRLEPGSDVPVPVRDLDVTSLITSPCDGQAVRQGTVTVRGWAWGAVPVTAVDIGVGGTWLRADLEPASAGGFAWQQFSAGLRLGPGDYRILARATDRRGRVQPQAGARNQVHAVPLRVLGNGWPDSQARATLPRPGS
jgi:DMSO/TMAO reductase YedYZ molybdopterin-dependent catalytic subunit